jgi:hypothetical protein
MQFDLVEEIKACPEIMAKIQQEDRYYAQNLYCAWSNMQWCKRELWPILKEEYWTASWRGAGGIVAELRGQGEDYMDYYCSGMKGGLSYDTKDDDKYFEDNRYVSEGEVTDEIAEDLNKLGWMPVPYNDDLV